MTVLVFGTLRFVELLPLFELGPFLWRYTKTKKQTFSIFLNTVDQWLDSVVVVVTVVGFPPLLRLVTRIPLCTRIRKYININAHYLGQACDERALKTHNCSHRLTVRVLMNFFFKKIKYRQPWVDDIYLYVRQIRFFTMYVRDRVVKTVLM